MIDRPKKLLDFTCAVLDFARYSLCVVDGKGLRDGHGGPGTPYPVGQGTEVRTFQSPFCTPPDLGNEVRDVPLSNSFTPGDIGAEHAFSTQILVP